MIDSNIYQEDLRAILNHDYPWEQLEGHDVMITGANGLIGSIIVDVLIALLDKYDFSLTAVSRNKESLEKNFSYCKNEKFNIVSKDVNEPMDEFESDIIFHCASNTHPQQYSTDPIGTIFTNVIGLKNLLDMASKRQNSKFIFASSVEVYGINDKDALDETSHGYIDCNTLRAGYNESKRLGESICQAYRHKHDIKCIIPRISRCYGPSLKPDDTKALSQFIKNGLSKKDIVLKSKGMQRYSYCYSADAANALLYLLFYGKDGEAYNISGPDNDMRLNDIAEYIAKISGTEVVYDIPDEIESIGYSKAENAVLDISKIKSLGWMPQYNLKDGLLRTITSFGESTRGQK